MFRNDKKWVKIITSLAITLILLSSYLFYAETLADGSVNDKDTVETKEIIQEKKRETITVSYSNYTEKSTLKDVEWIFLKNDTLTLNGAQGTFVEFLISSGEFIKQGDPILSYQSPYDMISIEELKLSLERKESAYKKDLKQKEEYISQEQKKLQSMDYSSIDAMIVDLNIKKLEIENRQYQIQAKKSINELKEVIKEQTSKIELQYILAPYDGVVFLNDKIEEGKALDPYGELAYIYDTESAVLGTTVNGPINLWYGLEVEVTGVSSKKEDKSTIHNGKVIAVDSLLNGKANTGKIYIKLEDENLLSSMQSGNITAQTVSIEGVLVIPTKVVKYENDMTYVYILDQDDELRKQYITGRDNGTDMWVYSGLSEGQRIVIE